MTRRTNCANEDSFFKHHVLKSNIFNSSDILKGSGKVYLQDVTLVSSEKIQTKSYKTILSACSRYFKTLLVNHPHPHSHVLIHLTGISDIVLQSILIFIYSGEVRVDFEEKENFLQALKELQVKGLNSKESQQQLLKYEEDDEEEKFWIKNERDFREDIDTISYHGDSPDHEVHDGDDLESIHYSKAKWTAESKRQLRILLEENYHKVANSLLSKAIHRYERSKIFKVLTRRLNRELDDVTKFSAVQVKQKWHGMKWKYEDDNVEFRVSAKNKQKLSDSFGAVDPDIYDQERNRFRWTVDASDRLRLLLEENDGEIVNLLSSKIDNAEKSKIFKALAGRMNVELNLDYRDSLCGDQVKQKWHHLKKKILKYLKAETGQEALLVTNQEAEKEKAGLPPKLNFSPFKTNKLKSKFFCNDCKFDLLTAEGLKRHKDKKQIGPYGCGECEFVTKDKFTLTMHYDHKHIKVTKYICDICCHPSTSIARHTYHMGAYHREKKHACPVEGCDFTGLNKFALKKHNYMKHEDTRKYACDRCPYTAKLPANLRTHIAGVHEGVKHKCNKCNSEFSTDQALQRHVRFIHKGIKYTCEICGYECAQPNRLREHTEKHHT